MRNGMLAASLFLAVVATACSQADGPATSSADAAAPAEPATTGSAHAEAVAAPAVATDAATRACMIAGEFEILGQRVRSRDCLQAGADIPEQAHRELCESLAQTSAQMGGKAGEVTYLDTCPSPSQGSCKGLFGQASLHAFYYERSHDDLASLPASCQAGGGTWLD